MNRVELQMRNNVFLANCTLHAKESINLLGIVDSGANRTYVSRKVCELAGLKRKGTTEDTLCVHGRQHSGVPIQYYRGLVTLGTKPGSGRVYEIDTRLVVGGLLVDVLLGRDILRHFKVTLDWKGGTGYLEE